MVSRIIRVVFWLIGLVVIAISVILLLPSLIGALIFLLLVFTCIDLANRRYRSSVRTFNSLLREVSRREGGIHHLAVAFSKTGPLRGPCHDYATRLAVGEDALDAAVAAKVPLQLSTAISLSNANLSAESESGTDRESRAGGPPELVRMESASILVFGQFVYLGVTLVFTCLVMLFIATFIVPMVKRIFEEFELQIPLQFVFDAASSVWLLALVGVLLVVLSSILNRFRWLGIRLPRWIPMTPRMAEKRADFLCGLADGIEADWPLSRTIGLGSTICHNRLQRRSLELAAQRIDQGVEPMRAIEQAGWLDSGELAWLQDAPPRRVGVLLRQFASNSVQDACENLRWWMAFVFPASIFVLALIVLAYAIAFFGALSGLIYDLS